MFTKALTLASIAAAIHAIKLAAQDNHETETSTLVEDMVAEQTMEAMDLDHHDLVNTTASHDSHGSCGCGGCSASCGCGCGSGHKNMVNLPKSVYEDPQLKAAAQTIVDDIDPDMMNLAIPLGLTADEVMGMEADVLFPAIEAALAGVLETNPGLADSMPDLPSTLEAAIAAVRSKMAAGSSVVDEETGATIHTMAPGDGWIDSQETLEQVEQIQKLTPSVIFISDEACGEKCDEFEARWLKMRKEIVGAAYYRVDSDQLPEINQVMQDAGVVSTPAFIVSHQDEFLYAANGQDWGHLRRTVADATRADLGGEQSSISASVPGFNNTHVSMDVAEHIAEALDVSHELE